MSRPTSWPALRWSAITIVRCRGSGWGNGFVHAILRAGNVASAEGLVRFLDKALEKCRGLGVVLDLRIDAGLTHGEVLDHLTERKTRFVGRLKPTPFWTGWPNHIFSGPRAVRPAEATRRSSSWDRIRPSRGGTRSV